MVKYDGKPILEFLDGLQPLILEERGPDMSLRIMPSIRINNNVGYNISIQGGSFPYSIPRRYFKSFSSYTHLEIAFKNNEGFISLNMLKPLLINKPQLITLLEDYYTHPIFAFVPVRLIQELVTELC